MKKYSNIIFDLFDTLILFKPELLPKIEINDREHFSTGKDVFKAFSVYYTDYGFDEFITFFFNSYKEFQGLKNIDNREYPNRKRFEIMLDMMGLPIDNPKILEKLVISHMDSLSRSMVFPEEYRATIEELIKRGYKLSILSNFDYSPTAHKLLELYNITNYFNYIFISEEIGWRKPSPSAFRYVIDRLDISPSEAVFIGDDYEKDIIGARNSNIDSIYVDIKKKRDTYSPAIASVNEFKQILDILQ